MRRTLTLLIGLALFTTGCMQIDLENETIPQIQKEREDKKTRNPFNVSLETAKYTASVLSHEELISLEPIVFKGKDTVLYVANFNDGWMVLSGDKRAVPILASSVKGTFKSEINNPGAALWFDQLANEVLSLKLNNPSISKEELDSSNDYAFWMNMERAAISQENSNLKSPIRPEDPRGIPFLCKKLVSTSLVDETSERYGPLLSTKWGQEEPWNTNLPSVWVEEKQKYLAPPVGCTAVAMAQILYFTHYKFNEPSGLYHTISSTGQIYNDDNFNTVFTRGDYVENSPRWDQMPLTKFEANVNYVADLLADVGNRLGMKYAYDGSGSNLSHESMMAYGLTYDEDDYNPTKVIDQLHNGMPVMVSSAANITKSGWLIFAKPCYTDRHIWIIDGTIDNYKRMKQDYIWEIVYIPNNSSGNNPPSSNLIDNSDPGGNSPQPSNPNDEDVNDLYLRYAEVLPYNTGDFQEVYPGLTETKYFLYTTHNLLMNWGWNGSYDLQEYSSTATIWPAGGYNFQYEKKIYYNIRKK